MEDQWNLGRAYRLMGRHKDAIANLETRLDDSPASLAPRVELAASYSELGRNAKARGAVTAIMQINPGFSVRRWLQIPPYKDKTTTAVREAAVLLKAGLPE